MSRAACRTALDYLNERSIPINVLCFQVFAHGNDQILSRAWLHDPVEVQGIGTTTSKGPSEPWNGEFYCSFGHDECRSWEEAVQFGFICGGGGTWFSGTLRLLNPGDRVWVNVPKTGYVGVGRVTGVAQPASTFMVPTPKGDKPVLEVTTRATYHREYVDDLDKCEWFVPIQWLDTRPLSQAVHETGFFGLQHTVCRPASAKWRTTVERLKQVFTRFDG